MIILQIGAAFSGAQKEIESEIHKDLKKNGHESYILYAYGESDAPNIICFESHIESCVRRGMQKAFGKNPCFAFISTLRLIKYIKRIKPDIVHLHVIHHGYTDYPVLLNYLAKHHIPVVFSMHDMWGATGGCYHYTNANCCNYRNGCFSCPLSSKVLDCRPNQTSYYFNKKLSLYQQFDKLAFVAVSQWVHDELKKTAVSNYPIYTVWNCVSAPKNLAHLLRNEKFTIIGVASCWDERKGFKRFLELSNLLGDEYKIIIVGSVSPENKNTAPSNICFLGAINDRARLYQLYASSDLHVSLSTEETFGMTFIEAAMAGTKSIGFDSTAIPYVLNKVNGFIIEAGNVTAMAEKITELFRNPSACGFTSDEMDAISKSFSTEKMVSEYEAIYTKMLS